jgi:hypothetical protein
MAELATLSDSGEPQKEGTRIATVDQQGNVQTHAGKEIPASGGIADANTKWGARSMGNGGVVT